MHVVFSMLILPFFVFYYQHHDVMLRLCEGGKWELAKLKE